MRLLQRDAVPVDVRSEFVTGFEPGERILAWARGGPGTTSAPTAVVATDRGLWLELGGRPERLRWADIATASWRDGQLRLTRVGGAPLVIDLEEPHHVPEVVRDRVTASIVLNTHRRLGDRGGVRVLARRNSPGEPLHWQAVFDPGVDAHDPVLRARADAFLREVRESVGE
jgi:hypothetical protein